MHISGQLINTLATTTSIDLAEPGKKDEGHMGFLPLKGLAKCAFRIPSSPAPKDSGGCPSWGTGHASRV